MMMPKTPYILPYKGDYCPEGVSPTISDDAFIAPGAAIIGDVEIGADTGVWFNCTIRGDVNKVRIGKRTNIQDGSVIHVTRETAPTIIGDGVTIGHSVLLHGCELQDNCFIGMRATLMDGVVVESGAMVAAGALVTPGKTVPKGQLWAGSPAKYFRDLSEKDLEFFPVSAENYVKHAREYLAMQRAK